MAIDFLLGFFLSHRTINHKRKMEYVRAMKDQDPERRPHGLAVTK